MTRISFDLRFADLPGGGGVYTAQLARALVGQFPDMCWRFYTLPGSPSIDGLIRQIRIENGIDDGDGRIELCPVRSPVLSLGQHVEFLRFRDDAALYHYPHFDLPIGLHGVPAVVTIHDLYPLTVRGYCGFAKRRYFYSIASRAVRHAAHVITISQQSRTDILNNLGICEEKISVIAQGYSPEFRPINDEEHLGCIRATYRLPERFIYYAGNLKPHKNLARFIEAFSRLPESLRDYKFVLSGALEGRTSLQSVIEQYGVAERVRFLGLLPQEDLPAVYNLASLFVLPSLYEGFGLCPLEAMACGTPVICSNSPALPEVVGEAARLFDPLSIEEMAAVLQTALENDVDNDHVRQTVLAHAPKYSWTQTARKTYRVYQDLIRNDA